MGWTFIRNATKQQVIDERLAPQDWTLADDNYTRRYSTNPPGTRIQSIVLAFRCVADSLWYVREVTTTTPDGTTTTTKYIALDMLENHGGWGYKAFDESMGPYDWTCPPEFFDLVPDPPNEYAANWRANIRKAHPAPAAAQVQLIPAPAAPTGLCGYVCFYNRQRIEVYAATSLQAQTEAARILKVKPAKAYQISVNLCHRADGSEVIHTPAC